MHMLKRKLQYLKNLWRDRHLKEVKFNFLTPLLDPDAEYTWKEIHDKHVEFCFRLMQFPGIDSAFIGSAASIQGHVGGFVGKAVDDGHSPQLNVNRSYVEAQIWSGDGAAGGLLGNNVSGFLAYLNDTYFIGSVYAETTGAGGLVGRSEDRLEIARSYAAGSVTANFSEAGGLVGYDLGGTVVQSFAAAQVTGGGSDAGLLGYKGVEVEVEDVWLDETTAGTGCEDYCVKVNTAEEPNPDYFKGTHMVAPLDTWNFPDTWHVRANNYPNLTPIDDPQILCEQSQVGKDWMRVACSHEPAGWGLITWEMQYHQTGDPNWTDVILDDSTMAVARIGGLKAGTSYETRFRFTNDFGTSEWGRIEATTLAGDATDTAVATPVKAPVGVTFTDIQTPVDLPDTTKIVLNNFGEYFSGGMAFKLKVGQVIYFTVNGVEHSATVKEVGADYIVVTLASTPRDYRINVGTSPSFDVNQDGIDDIQITLNSVNEGLANVTFKVVQSGKEVATQLKLKLAKNNSASLQIIVVLVLLGLIAIAVRRKKHQTAN